jgi:hypothetical protein
MDVKAWVEEHIGADQAVKLEHIGQGGENNKKGSAFENFYAASKICCLAAEKGIEAIDDFHIGCQEVAFVDDLCVRQQSTKSKTNYQAKNSDGAAANWTAEMQKRFEMQRRIDVELHLSTVSTQILLVSSSDKAAANDAKIPDDMKGYCASEHFPYFTSSTQLVLGHPPLREALNALCGSTSYSNADAAFRLVLGEWCADNEAGRTVGDVMRKATANARPNLFAPFSQRLAKSEESKAAMPLTPEDAPRWLVDLLAAFQMPGPTVECGAFIVSYNGMQARVASNVLDPKPETLAELKSLGDIFLFLMSLAAEGLDDQLPTGENRQ